MTEPNPADGLDDSHATYEVATPLPLSVLIENPDTGRKLLAIHPDGTVTGEIEDASEAARVFVECVRVYLQQPTQAAEIERLRVALQRIAYDENVSSFQSNPRNNPMFIARAALLQEQTNDK